jgi:hypothetical protein
MAALTDSIMTDGTRVMVEEIGLLLINIRALAHWRDAFTEGSREVLAESLRDIAAVLDPRPPHPVRRLIHSGRARDGTELFRVS